MRNMLRLVLIEILEKKWVDLLFFKILDIFKSFGNDFDFLLMVSFFNL